MKRSSEARTLARRACSAVSIGLFALRALDAQAAEDEPKKDKHAEFTLVPFAGGDSDVGFGGGFIASWARVSPDYEPYLLRIESATAMTFKRPEDSWRVPYTDAYVLIDAPHLVPNRLRLRFRVSYTREQRLPYSGLGNASTKVPEAEDEHSRYTRVHPTADLQT